MPLLLLNVFLQIMIFHAELRMLGLDDIANGDDSREFSIGQYR